MFAQAISTSAGPALRLRAQPRTEIGWDPAKLKAGHVTTGVVARAAVALLQQKGGAAPPGTRVVARAEGILQRQPGCPGKKTAGAVAVTRRVDATLRNEAAGYPAADLALSDRARQLVLESSVPFLLPSPPLL